METTTNHCWQGIMKRQSSSSEHFVDADGGLLGDWYGFCPKRAFDPPLFRVLVYRRAMI